MFVASLTDEELETLVVALKFWRRHRRVGRARKTDRVLPPAAVDELMTKLGMGIALSAAADEAIPDLFSH